MEEKDRSIVLSEGFIVEDSSESSELDMNELLEVEGGLDVDECVGDCGLGCFLAGVY